MKRTLIIGASGSFGERLRRHLTQFNDQFKGIELWVSSRSEKSVQAMVLETRQWLADANRDIPVHGVVLDINKDIGEKLKAIKPFAVLDLSGPYQFLGYDLCKAALEAGAHILDLADANGYLMGYEKALNAWAKVNGVMALAGASSTPALSYSVVSHLTKGWQEVKNIEVAIMPAGKSQVGGSVVKAVLSYCGKPVTIWKDGKLDKARGWKYKKTFSMPNLRDCRCAHVDTVDAALMGPAFKVSGSAAFYAGLESKLEQFCIESMSKLVALMQKRFGISLNLTVLEPILSWGRNLTQPFNSDSGGMVVVVEGVDEKGAPRKRQFSLIARSDHGPSIPIMAMAAGLQKLLESDGVDINPRACLAHEFLTMEEILDQTKAYDISWQVDEVVQ